MKKKVLDKVKKIAAAACMITMTALATITTGLTEVKAQDELTGKEASEIVKMMGVGFNIGNTLDADGGMAMDAMSNEISWGNPKITEEFVDSVIAQGFKTIRIPITWYRYVMLDGSYKILDNYMKRVHEVVDYAYGKDVFIIINVHHEEWINRADLVEAEEDVKTELTAIWAQLADEFADYDQHLIFEGMNEPRLAGTNKEWSGDPACSETINNLNQAFVDTVRSNGKGYNKERVLMCPDYAASSSKENMDRWKMPQIGGKNARNVVVSIHSYTPYTFALTENKSTFDPAADGKDIDWVFKCIKETFLDKGICAVMGETSATNKDNEPDRIAWANYMGQVAGEAGVPIVLWDNGSNAIGTGECHDYMDRHTGENRHPEMISAVMTSYEEALANSTYQMGTCEYSTDDDIVVNASADEAGAEVEESTDDSAAVEEAVQPEEAPAASSINIPLIIGIICAAIVIIVVVVIIIVKKKK